MHHFDVEAGCFNLLFGKIFASLTHANCLVFFRVRLHAYCQTSSWVFFLQLLGRVFSILCRNNPGLAGRTHMTVMTLRNVLRHCTKKTLFVNFMDSCQKCVSFCITCINALYHWWCLLQTDCISYISRMRMQPKHVMDFLLSELPTGGSLDGQ
jgi:translation initiation factor 2 subunit 2